MTANSAIKSSRDDLSSNGTYDWAFAPQAFNISAYTCAFASNCAYVNWRPPEITAIFSGVCIACPSKRRCTVLCSGKSFSVAFHSPKTFCLCSFDIGISTELLKWGFCKHKLSSSSNCKDNFSIWFWVKVTSEKIHVRQMSSPTFCKYTESG